MPGACTLLVLRDPVALVASNETAKSRTSLFILGPRGRPFPQALCSLVLIWENWGLESREGWVCVCVNKFTHDTD